MIDLSDQVTLMAVPAFQRFLFAVIQTSGIFGATANGTDGRNLFNEGRRSLGLEVLRMMDGAQPVQSPSGIPVLTLIQILREEAQSTPKEKTVGKRDAYSELRDEDRSA